MKKSLLFILIAVILLTAVMLVACDEESVPPADLGNGGTDGNGGTTGGNGQGTITTVKSNYAFATVGSGALLSGLSAENEDAVPSNAPANGQYVTQDELPAEDLATINRYLGIVESFLSDSGVTFTETESDKEGYAFKLVAQSKDITGKATEFILYYNETRTVVDEDETKTALEGIMSFNGQEYTVRGERESAFDENEMEFIAYIDRANYVKIEQEQEDGENEYSYTVVENGITTAAFELEIETEADETEVEIRSYENNVTTVIDFKEKIAANGKSHIEATFVENNVMTRFSIHVTENPDGTESYLYKFSTGKEVNMNRCWDD